MSHVVTQDIEILNLDYLKGACERTGKLEFMEGQQTFKWYGKHVGDYPLPKGFTKEDMGKCEHAIRVTNNEYAYEVGVVKRRDGKEGYILMYDFWAGGGGLMDIIGQNAVNLCKEYSIERTVQELQNEGYEIEFEKNEQGELQVIGVQY